MRLGFLQNTARGSLDRALALAAAQCSGRGLRLCGAVQLNTERLGSTHCDMDLMILPAGPQLRISQPLGEGAKGCRLDVGALEQAVAACAQSLAQADLLILNKFGKHEAEGRGFRELIAEALALDIPVLTGVNSLNLQAFLEFSGGLAQELTAASLPDWLAQINRKA